MPSVTGTIKRADTSPVASTSFTIMRISGDPMIDRKTVTTHYANQLGNFIINLQPGRYRFYWGETDMIPFTVGTFQNYRLSAIVDYSPGY